MQDDACLPLGVPAQPALGDEVEEIVQRKRLVRRRVEMVGRRVVLDGAIRSSTMPPSSSSAVRYSSTSISVSSSAIPARRPRLRRYSSAAPKSRCRQLGKALGRADRVCPDPERPDSGEVVARSRRPGRGVGGSALDRSHGHLGHAARQHEAAADEHRADRARRRRRHRGVQGGVRRGVHRFTLDDLARCRAGRALWTRRSRGTSWTLWPSRSRLACQTLRARRSVRTGRSFGAGSSRRPGGTLRACRSLRASRTSGSLGTSWARSAGRSVRTGRSGGPGSSRRPGGSLRACRALRPSRTSGSLGTSWARRADRADWTHRAGRT